MTHNSAGPAVIRFRFQGEGVRGKWAGVDVAGTAVAASRLLDPNSGPELEDGSGDVCSPFT